MALMQTRADEIKTEIRDVKSAIAKAMRRIPLANLPATVEALNLYIERKTARLWQLQGQLEREEALYIKPEGPCVTLAHPDGSEWKV